MNTLRWVYKGEPFRVLQVEIVCSALSSGMAPSWYTVLSDMTPSWHTFMHSPPYIPAQSWPPEERKLPSLLMRKTVGIWDWSSAQRCLKSRGLWGSGKSQAEALWALSPLVAKGGGSPLSHKKTRRSESRTGCSALSSCHQLCRDSLLPRGCLAVSGDDWTCHS